MKLELAVVTLWAKDANRTADFYREMLGLPIFSLQTGKKYDESRAKGLICHWRP